MEHNPYDTIVALLVKKLPDITKLEHITFLTNITQIGYISSEDSLTRPLLKFINQRILDEHTRNMHAGDGKYIQNFS
jgi:hypothetical protein